MYLLKSKDEVLYYFKIYKAEVENLLEEKIKRLWSDHGGEYFSNEFSEFCMVQALFIRGRHHTHHNPVGLQRERITL
jgi:hypothetical protein